MTAAVSPAFVGPVETTHATYSHLVQGPNDFIGLIAYSLYKSDKLAFVRDHTDATGKAPDDREMLAFCRTVNLPGQISAYRSKAAVLAEEFTEEVLENSIEAVKADYKEQLVVELRKSRSFWRSVGENLVANVLAAGLTVLLVVLVYGSKIGFPQLFGDIFGYEVHEKASPPKSD